MSGRTIILAGQSQRNLAKQLIDRAPPNAVFNVREASRTLDQNAKLWAMLTDIARAKPMGRKMEPEHWKSVFMDAIGKKPHWIPNLEGDGVLCTGYRSSHLSKQEMSDLIEQMYSFGTEHGVVWNAKGV